jgi:Lar family restriction alleviation protein
MNPPLLPWPFCGGSARIESHAFLRGRGAWFVRCDGCGGRVGASADRTNLYDDFVSKEDAIEAWNRRAFKPGQLL